MIGGLKPYTAARDSGEPLLGEVPAHWSVYQLRSIGRLLKGVGGTKEDAVSEGVPCVRYGDLYTTHDCFIRRSRTFIMESATNNYTRIQRGDVLFAASGETIDDIGQSAVNLMDGPAYCGGDTIILRPALPVIPEFMGYATGCRPSVIQKAKMARGTTVKHVYPDQLKSLVLCLPPLPEQAAIVRFLEYTDRRLRRYILAKHKLIKLLEEQKQAIVHRAVTRGLDPNVRLKPSGVEWLGEVPEHWEIVSFTRTAIERADYRGATPPKTESGVFLVTARNVRKGWIDYDASKEFVAEEDYPTIMRRGLPKLDDLLLTMEAPLGHAALVDREDIALAQRVVRFRFDRHRVDPSFVLRSVLSPYFQNQLLCRGTGSTAVGIKASKLPQLQLLVPPFPEQLAVLNWLDHECKPADIGQGQAQSEIALLREYRTRLIADVVTGKLDVREAAAKLPEEAGEPDTAVDTGAPEDGDEEIEGAEAADDGAESADA